MTFQLVLNKNNAQLNVNYETSSPILYKLQSLKNWLVPRNNSSSLKIDISHLRDNGLIYSKVLQLYRLVIALVLSFDLDCEDTAAGVFVFSRAARDHN